MEAMRRMHCLTLGLGWMSIGWLGGLTAGADESAPDQVVFVRDIKPFIDEYCLDCHQGKRAKAKFDISVYHSEADVVADFGHWDLILDQLVSGAMPPEEADGFPEERERMKVVGWIKATRRREAERNAGDPGVISARRLSHSEYNYTIRDLTGVDIRPTREFPIDPANEAGFDNTGESLVLSPALLKKYLGAAREVADHLALLPDGITFAEHPVVTDTDRDKYAVKRIVDFYKRQPTELEDYLVACYEIWKSADECHGSVSLEIVSKKAQENGVSSKYLLELWNLLVGEDFNSGPIARLRTEWRTLVKNEFSSEREFHQAVSGLVNWMEMVRNKLAVTIDFPKAPQIHSGSQTMVLWRNRRQAASRRSLNDAVLIRVESAKELQPNMDPDLVLVGDAAEQEKQLEAFRHFCSVIPNKFYISERGREFLQRDEPAKGEQGRLLSAGFHSMMGYFRDDQPLMELILSEQDQAELDHLWQKLDFVTMAPMRQHAGFVWFERTDSRYMRDPEFDFARAEDKDVTSEEKILRLGEVYLAKAVENRADQKAQEAIREYFENINASVRSVESDRSQAEAVHLEALVNFAERAFRRPITELESEDLLAFYKERRELESASHEEAFRDSLVSVLVSPQFWFRMYDPTDGPGIQPLTDIELASRLSYFLWSSMPDQELMDLAVTGRLRNRDVLKAQVSRMIQDHRARALAVEFGGAWLDFRRFENHNSVDRGRFPQFDDDLRQAMYEEPIRFFLDVLRNDRSVRDFLFAKDSWINADLAEHYGLDWNELSAQSDPDGWALWAEAEASGRGGILPMAVFQTKNAPGLRTSPVKRGYWVVKQLLGEHIPAPPPNVPELPSDEGASELSLPDQLARHRDDPSCAGCHERFDGIGLAFEGYGPVGERRSMDLGGRAVQNHSIFPGGSEGTGLEGLKAYLSEHRQEEFVENLTRKLFSYAIGRSLILSDDPVIEEILENLNERDDRMQALIEQIVTSPQFLNKRGRLDLAER